MIRHARIPLLFVAAIFVLTGCAASSGISKDSFESLSGSIRNLEKRMEAVEARQRNMVDVLAKARGAVAFIWGTYTFVDKDGHPLRHVVSDSGEPITDPKGVPLVDVKGTGPLAVTNYCGTAFLAGPGGEMLTNRHVAQPWWEDDASAPLLAAGLKPAFVRLRAFFQERSTGVPIEILRIDEKQDLALVKTVNWVPTTPPLELQSKSAQVEEGQPVILVGYPTGLEAVIARLEERDALEKQLGSCSYQTAEELSEQKKLRATITSGFLWDVLPHLLVYDARTIGGGSGGPLLDWSGRVIGVNAAYLEAFQGGNYGVPADFGERLLSGGGLVVQEAREESQELLRCYEREKEQDITSCTP